MSLIPEPSFYNNFVTWSNLERLLHSMGYNPLDVLARRDPMSRLSSLMKVSVHCALSIEAQCIVIGPVCGGRARADGGRAVSVSTITRNCVHGFSPNVVCR